MTPEIAEAEVGRGLELRCSVQGRPIEHIAWYKDARQLRLVWYKDARQLRLVWYKEARQLKLVW